MKPLVKPMIDILVDWDSCRSLGIAELVPQILYLGEIAKDMLDDLFEHLEFESAILILRRYDQYLSIHLLLMKLSWLL